MRRSEAADLSNISRTVRKCSNWKESSYLGYLGQILERDFNFINLIKQVLSSIFSFFSRFQTIKLPL